MRRRRLAGLCLVVLAAIFVLACTRDPNKLRAKHLNRGEKYFKERNQIKKEPVAIGFALEKFDGRKKKDQVGQDRNFRSAMLARFEILNLQIWSKNAPIKIENRQRDENDSQRHSLRKLPTRSFQLPGSDHHDRKGDS